MTPWAKHPASEVPDGHYNVPLGKAAVVREGEELTIEPTLNLMQDTSAATRKERLEAIPGVVPNLLNPPVGCRFAPRCRYAMPKCREAVPPLLDLGGGQKVACVLYQPEMAA